MTDLHVDLNGRVAVVTGGGSGIGKATALALARSGARVFVGDLELREPVFTEFSSLKIEASRCDVRSLDELQRLIDHAADAGGGLDILISNAGVVFVRDVEHVDESDWDRVLDTNLKAAFFGAKFAIPHFRKRNGGCIVNTSSNAGLLPRAHDPVYSISKLALVGLTKSLALSLAAERIRVNCICPGPVDGTEIMDGSLRASGNPQQTAQAMVHASPLARAHGRMMHPEEIAQSILYLCSDAAVMVTGTAIAIDGGKSLGVPPS
jgi:3-oxoacyl-[acyl-carrier protein] reductase